MCGFFDKICSQMLNNFIAFNTVFYNFHVALFSLTPVKMTFLLFQQKNEF